MSGLARLWMGGHERSVEQWKLDALEKRSTVRVIVLQQDQYDRGAFDFGGLEFGSLDRVMTSLARIRKAIPPAFREYACCKIDSVGGYEGDHYASIEVSYERPETDEEWASRRANVERRLAEQQAREREMYEAMKAKFEPGT